MLFFTHKKLLSLLICSCFITHGSVCIANPDSLAQQISKDFTTVAKKAIPAVVSIKVSNNSSQSDLSDDMDDSDDDDILKFFFGPRKNHDHKEPVMGQASGFIISPEGYLLTNSHVVKNVNTINVTLNDGREYSAKVVGVDPNTDIALLKIDADKLPYIQLGNSDQLDIGQWVVAIGNPLGLQASLTVGVVSAKGRNNLDLANIEDFIQTDAAINRGNSGGPLLNLEGQVVGMNTAIVTNTGGGGYMGIGFAIPSNMLKHIMEQLKTSGSVTRGFIGVTLQNIDQNLAHAFNLNQMGGALISDVTKDSPAEKAGLKQGDIVQSYNSLHVSNIASLRNAIALMPPGAEIKLSVLRNGKNLEVPVVIGTFPTSSPKAVSLRSGNKLGFEVQDLTPDVARTLGLPEDSGVVINKVIPGSAASWAGLKKGALIIAVNQKYIRNVEEFTVALEQTPVDKPVLLLIKQGEAVRYISLKAG